MNLRKYINRLLMLTVMVPLALPAFSQDGEIAAGIVVEHLKKTMEKMERSIEERPEFEIDKAPERWANESSVLLMRYVRYEAFADGDDEKVRVYSRYRIKLQDQFAINDYSEFYFGEQDLLFIKIIKPDGDSYEIDMEDAVTSDSRSEDYLGLSGFSVNVDAYKKIAVPNLEKGDIVEVTQVSENIFWSKTGGVSYYLYPSHLNTVSLGRGVPVYHDIMEFDLESPFRLNFKSMNGAPKIQAVKIRDEHAEFIFHDSLRNRTKTEYWSGGLGYNPSIKYVISKYYSSSRTLDFARKEMDVLSGVTDKDLIHYANRVYREKKRSHSGVYRDFIKQYKGDKIVKNEDYARNFYYYYRTRAFMAKKERRFSNISFVTDFTRILKKRKIEFEYLVAIPLTLGGIESLISMDEMVWGIRLKSNGMIYSRFNAFSTPNEMSQHFYGHDIYVIDAAKKKSAMAVSREKLTVPTPGENKIHYTMKLKLADDFKTATLEREIEAYGRQKAKFDDFIPNMELWNEDLKRDGLERDKLEMPAAFYALEIANDPDRMEEENERIQEGFHANNRKYMERQVKRDLNGDGILVEKVNTVEVVDDGRQTEAGSMTLKDESVVENVVSRSGEYYIVELGMVLGSQFELRDSEDKNRIEPIYFGYTREYTYELRMDIPPGMKVSGMDQFNRQVDNEVGSFEVTSKVVDGVLIVKSIKRYKGIEFPKEKWDEVNAFIELASDVNQSKIILSR